MLTLIRTILILALMVNIAIVVGLARGPAPLDESAPPEMTYTPVTLPAAGPTYTSYCEEAPPKNFDEIVESAAAEFEIDPRVLATTVYRESACDQKALGSSGEIGLAQVHPRVWTGALKEAGIIRSSKDLWRPRTNLRAAAWIIASLSEDEGADLWDVFRRYNGSGPKANQYASGQVKLFRALWAE